MGGDQSSRQFPAPEAGSWSEGGRMAAVGSGEDGLSVGVVFGKDVGDVFAICVPGCVSSPRATGAG